MTLAETLHNIMLYLRLMAYIFLAYSMVALAIARYTSSKQSAMLHFVIAALFSVGAVVVIVTRLCEITDRAAFMMDVMDFVVTPLLILGMAFAWRLLIKRQQERVKRIEKKIKNGNNNSLAHNTS